MELRVLVCVVLLAVQGRADSVCTSGFPTVETVMDTAARGELTPLLMDGFRVWLFPSMNFSCTGTISRWRFQAVGSGSGTMLPQMQVWREIIQTPLAENYMRQSSSGTKDELRVIGDSVYEYVLTSPVAVSEGDIFGVLLPEATDRELLLQFQDFGQGGAPQSFLTPRTENFFPTGGAQVAPNIQYLPLVTAVLDTPVFPSATSTQVSSMSTIAASSIPATPSLPVATSSLSVSPTPNQPTTGTGGSGSNAGIVAAAVICSIVGVLVVCAVIVAIVIFVLKKRQPEIYEVKRRPDRMDNPVYTGVVSGVEDKRLTTKSTTSSGSYHIYAMPTQPFSPGGNREGVPQPNGTIEQHPIGDGLSGEHYEFSEGVQTLETHGYYQLEDMEASVKSATLASQYEVPVSTVSSTLSSEVESPFPVLQGFSNN